jgi:hypothetical protein
MHIPLNQGPIRGDVEAVCLAIVMMHEYRSGFKAKIID